MEFTSDRKRASILVRDPSDGLIKLFIKGADNIIDERLHRNQLASVRDHMLRFVSQASRLGLRTLLFAMRVLDERELANFISDCEQAERDILNRDARLEVVYSNLEQDLTLIGATAVEDKLQDQVPETIHDL